MRPQLPTRRCDRCAIGRRAPTDRDGTRRAEERRLALRQTCVLERRSLIDAGKNSARHHGVEQGRALKRPLRRGGDERETDPGQKIPGCEPAGRRKRLTLRRCLPADARIYQNSTARARVP
jgi:hypothetical protein